MAAILKKAWEGYIILFEELPDPRTKPWLLAAKPYQGLTILGLYLMFIFKWGPQYMKGRPAYNLDKLLIVYNFLQVLTCIYILYNSLILAWGWHYKWICEPVDFSNTERATNIAKFTYYYFLMKVVDLIDTVFFVLRKKYNQITFLHIYHHTGMVLLTWAAATYLPGGHGTLVGVINTFVHIIMYSYYLYTVINPSAKQSVWWKKYITQLQILQFFWCVVHMTIIVFKPDCEYPRWTSAVFLPQNFFILVLFIDFYIKNYIRKPQAQQIADLQKKTTKLNSHKPSNGGIDPNICELKTLKQDLNVLNDARNAQNATETLQTGSHIGTKSPNAANGLQNGSHIYENESHVNSSRRSQNGTDENGSRNSCDNIGKDGKRGKLE